MAGTSGIHRVPLAPSALARIGFRIRENLVAAGPRYDARTSRVEHFVSVGETWCYDSRGNSKQSGDDGGN